MTLVILFDFLNKRDRTNRREIEAYNIKNASLGKWATEEKYRADAIFLNNDDGLQWYEKPEPSEEKKLENFRRAEAEVRKEASMRKLFASKESTPYSRKFSKWAYEKAPAAFSTYSGSGAYAGSGFKSSYDQSRSAVGFQGGMSFVPPMLQYPPAIPPPSLQQQPCSSRQSQPTYVPVGRNAFDPANKNVYYKCGAACENVNSTFAYLD